MHLLCSVDFVPLKSCWHQNNNKKNSNKNSVNLLYSHKKKKLNKIYSVTFKPTNISSKCLSCHSVILVSKSETKTNVCLSESTYICVCSLLFFGLEFMGVFFVDFYLVFFLFFTLIHLLQVVILSF